MPLQLTLKIDTVVNNGGIRPDANAVPAGYVVQDYNTGNIVVSSGTVWLEAESLDAAGLLVQSNTLVVSGGSSTLADLTDVALSSPADTEVLTYDSGSSKWVNAAGGAGGSLAIGDTVTDAIAGSVLFVDVDGKLGQDNANLRFEASHALEIGPPSSIPEDWALYDVVISADANSSTYGALGLNNAGIGQISTINFMRSRGTLDSPVLPQVGDILGQIYFYAIEPLNTYTGPRIYSTVTSETTQNGRIPGSISIETFNGNNVQERLRVTSAIANGIATPNASSSVVMAGQVEMQSGAILVGSLPTSDPAVAGQLWNDTGTVKVSAG
jgi:hypothetical protein